VKTLNLKSKIRRIPEFKGVVFWDIATLLKDKNAFKEVIDEFVEHYKNKKIDVVVSNEARGFIIGAPLAYALGAGFVTIRKKGKLPANVIEISYAKEYGVDTIQIHEDALSSDDIVLLHDDLLATGGTMEAAYELIKKFGVKKVYINFLAELDGLNGRRLFDANAQIDSLIHY